MRISDWSSDVCSSDLDPQWAGNRFLDQRQNVAAAPQAGRLRPIQQFRCRPAGRAARHPQSLQASPLRARPVDADKNVEGRGRRSEEHTSELQSLMRISYAVFCLKKKTKHHNNNTENTN